MGGTTSLWDKMTQEEKIEAFNAQIDNIVQKHGKMLEDRSDLSAEEKNEMQAEVTENAKNAKKEFAQKMQTEADSAENIEQSGFSEKSTGNNSLKETDGESVKVSEGAESGPENSNGMGE